MKVHSDLRNLCIGEFSVNVGRGAFTLVLGLYLYRETGSLWYFAFAFLSDFIIAIFIQGLAGSIVDRNGPMRILNMSLFLSTSVLAVCFFVLLIVDLGTAPLLFTGILLNLLRPFTRTAVFSLLPNIFNDNKLEKANGALSISLQAGQILGMLLAGLMLEFSNVISSIFAITISFFISTIFFYLLGKTSHSVSISKPENDINLDFVEYLTLLKNKHLQVAYIVGSFDYALIAIFNLLLAPVVVYNFNDMPRWLSILDGVFAAGALIAGIFIARSNRGLGMKFRFTFISLCSTGLLFFAYSMKWPSTLLIFLILIFGISTTFSVVVWNTTLQKNAPSESRGKVASVKYVANATVVAFSIGVVSLANDKSFFFATTAAYSLAIIFLVVGLLTKFRYSKIQSKTLKNCVKI